MKDSCSLLLGINFDILSLDDIGLENQYAWGFSSAGLEYFL